MNHALHLTGPNGAKFMITMKDVELPRDFLKPFPMENHVTVGDRPYREKGGDPVTDWDLEWSKAQDAPH